MRCKFLRVTSDAQPFCLWISVIPSQAIFIVRLSIFFSLSFNLVLSIPLSDGNFFFLVLSIFEYFLTVSFSSAFSVFPSLRCKDRHIIFLYLHSFEFCILWYISVQNNWHLWVYIRFLSISGILNYLYSPCVTSLPWLTEVVTLHCRPIFTLCPYLLLGQEEELLPLSLRFNLPDFHSLAFTFLLPHKMTCGIKGTFSPTLC